MHLQEPRPNVNLSYNGLTPFCGHYDWMSDNFSGSFATDYAPQLSSEECNLSATFPTFWSKRDWWEPETSVKNVIEMAIQKFRLDPYPSKMFNPAPIYLNWAYLSAKNKFYKARWVTRLEVLNRIITLCYSEVLRCFIFPTTIYQQSLR